MTQAKHTPGPWHHNGLAPSSPGVHDEQKACAVWARDKPIALCNFSIGKYSAVPEDEQDANARLIAAAPELLAALTDLSHLAATLVERQAAGHDIRPTMWSLLYKMTRDGRAAIAKARGEEG